MNHDCFTYNGRVSGSTATPLESESNTRPKLCDRDVLSETEGIIACFVCTTEVRCNVLCLDIRSQRCQQTSHAVLMVHSDHGQSSDLTERCREETGQVMS